MFQGIIEWWKKKQVLKIVEENPILKAVIISLNEVLTDESKGLGKYASKEFKKNLSIQVVKEASSILISKNPKMVNREYLCNSVIRMAEFGVIVLPPPPEDDPTGLRGKPGITGEIKGHLKELCRKNSNLKKFIWGIDKNNNITEGEIFDACLFEYWIAGLRANIANVIRVNIGDYHLNAKKDWYRPFIEAMYAWYEHNYRNDLGLDDVLANGPMGSLEGLKYSSYLDFVLRGDKYPNYSWEESYEEKKTK